MRKLVRSLVLAGTIAVLAGAVAARSLENAQTRVSNPSALSPAYCNAQHNVGNLVMSVSNYGTFGNGWSHGGIVDCFTGQPLTSCEFPKGSSTQYLWAGDLWVGAVVGTDTLVSTGGDGGSEFHPGGPGLGEMEYRSNIDPTQPGYYDAVSEQDYVAVYADTCMNCPGIRIDELEGRPHKPLQIEVTQTSYAWSYPYTEDFILIDYEIKNIGSERLEQVYVGLHMDADVHSLANSQGSEDDLTGFREKGAARYLPAYCPPDSHSLNLAWAADNDGGLFFPDPFQPVPHVTATRIVRAPSDSAVISYNWWVRPPEDYGPQARATYRDLRLTQSSPLGDRNKYHFLSNGEVDFDQHRMATISALDPIWMPVPPNLVITYPFGLDIRYLLSCGPFNIDPGESLPLTVAYVGGENFHTDGDNFWNLPENPDNWYNGVDFWGLEASALWAEWIYDNPGVDTDSDGYRGEFTVCDMGGVSDTIWRSGDGVPDYRAASPPPPPTFWLEPGDQSIHVRFNGLYSEITRDVFSRDQDFEGYNAYLSTNGSNGSFSRIASYDIEDYHRYRWDEYRSDWVISGRAPLTLETLRCWYGMSCSDVTWHPLDYTRQSPLVITGYYDSLIYFEPVMANASEFGIETPFVKRFPAAPMPPVFDADSIRVLFPGGGEALYLTPDGYFKYFEYEFTIEDLLPGQTYWVSMTSFDYGTLLSGTAPLESNIESRAKSATTLGGCCNGRVGDANGLGGDEPTIGDIALIVDAKFITVSCDGLIACLTEADVNQSGGANPTCDDITIGDVAILIDYLFITGPAIGLPYCF